MSRRRPTDDDQPTAIFEGRPAPGIRVISMKTPAAPKVEPAAIPRKATLRPLSELSSPAVNLPLGNLAPPRDEQAAARRHSRGTAWLVAGVLVVGVIVAVVFVFVAR